MRIGNQKIWNGSLMKKLEYWGLMENPKITLSVFSYQRRWRGCRKFHVNSLDIRGGRITWSHLTQVTLVGKYSWRAFVAPQILPTWHFTECSSEKSGVNWDWSVLLASQIWPRQKRFWVPYTWAAPDFSFTLWRYWRKHELVKVKFHILGNAGVLADDLL